MKEKVLLVNKFYYRRGGDCVVTMDLEKLLRSHGHEVAVFAMDYPENEESQWTNLFATAVDFGGSLGEKLRATRRALGYGDIRSTFEAVLDKFRPDVVHLHNIHSYLSPVVGEIASSRGIKVVWTLHDYKLVCPTYSCLSPRGEVCEECFTNRNAVVTRRCHKGSLAASIIARLESAKWNSQRLQRSTGMFICPSRFMAEKMMQGGFEAEKLTVLNNFHDSESAKVITERRPYYLYAGRLSREKGVETLLSVASTLNYRLTIAGDGPLSSELRHRYGDNSNITFLGRIDGRQVKEYMAHARFTVIPSEWYENNPLGVIESLTAGTPVVGSDMGGIPELINRHNGMIFHHGNSEDLRRAITAMWESDVDYNAIAEAARQHFSPEVHYNQIIKIYRSL